MPQEARQGTGAGRVCHLTSSCLLWAAKRPQWASITHPGATLLGMLEEGIETKLVIFWCDGVDCLQFGSNSRTLLIFVTTLTLVGTIEGVGYHLYRDSLSRDGTQPPDNVSHPPRVGTVRERYRLQESLETEGLWPITMPGALRCHPVRQKVAEDAQQVSLGTSWSHPGPSGVTQRCIYCTVSAQMMHRPL